ncbi:nuclear transport factor 2 family protein [Sphingomonas sp. NCPPB 2930]
MFHKTAITLVFAAALAACSAMPQGGNDGSANTGAVASVTAAAENLRRVMVDPTRPALDALVADDLSYGHSLGKVDTKASFISDLLDGTSDFITITITDQTVKVVKDVALVRHTLSAQTNDGGKPGNVTIKILQVWQQQGGQWKLLARQAVRPPV